MNTKYYTPTIEEFHVGFEFESPMHGSDEYAKHIFTLDSPNIMFNADDKGNLYYPENFFRVKYLDQEDIESLRGELIKPGIKTNTFRFENNGEPFHLVIVYNEIPIVEIYRGFNVIVDEIEIKNKYELKRLLTQLKI